MSRAIAIAAPLLSVGFDYMTGKMFGMDDQRALSTALGGTAGAYAGEYLGRKLPFKTDIPIPGGRGAKIPVHWGELAGSLIGGQLGYYGALKADEMARPNIGEGNGFSNPILALGEEAIQPGLMALKNFF